MEKRKSVSQSSRTLRPRRQHPQGFVPGRVVREFAAAKKEYSKATQVWVKETKVRDTLLAKEGRIKQDLQEAEEHLLEIKSQLKAIASQRIEAIDRCKKLSDEMDKCMDRYNEKRAIIEAMDLNPDDDRALLELTEALGDGKDAEVMPARKDRSEMTDWVTTLDKDEQRARAIKSIRTWNSDVPIVVHADYQDAKELREMCNEIKSRGCSSAFPYPVKYWLQFGNPDLAYFVGRICTERHFLELAKYDDLEFLVRLTLKADRDESSIIDQRHGTYCTFAWRMITTALESPDCSYRVFSYLMHYFLNFESLTPVFEMEELVPYWVSGFDDYQGPIAPIGWLQLPAHPLEFKTTEIRAIARPLLDEYHPNKRMTNPRVPKLYRHTKTVLTPQYRFERGHIPEMHSAWENGSNGFRIGNGPVVEFEDWMARAIRGNGWDASLHSLDFEQEFKFDIENERRASMIRKIESSASSSSPPEPPRSSINGSPVPCKIPLIDLSSEDSDAEPEERKKRTRLEEDDDEEEEEEEKKKEQADVSMQSEEEDQMARDQLAELELSEGVCIAHGIKPQRFLNQASKLYGLLLWQGVDLFMAVDPRSPKKIFSLDGRDKAQVREEPVSKKSVVAALFVIYCIVGISDGEWWSELPRNLISSKKSIRDNRPQ